MDYWIMFGFIAQGLFTMRFVVQWIASERAGESTVPHAFWLLSLAGSSLLLSYAIHQHDPVFIAGQSAGLLIYLRNIHLIAGKQKCA